MAELQEGFLDDGDWSEVQSINSYAVFMGYLSMAIKGLGYLALTWTTVVLLGGYVSNLDRTDFWCLTFITATQIAGIVDVNLNEKLHDMLNGASGMFMGVFWGLAGDPKSTSASLTCFYLACALAVVKMLVFVLVMCPLAIIYVSGILISGMISLWRLIDEHDYRIASESGSEKKETNLTPAIIILYGIALLQAVLFLYRLVMHYAAENLAKEVATHLADDLEKQLVYNYLRETRRGCEKDPLFVKGRNLITYAVDKIVSNSPVDCISGVKMLYTAICIAERVKEERIKQVNGQQMLMKHLIVSGSSSRPILHKLLEMLDSRGLHDNEMRYKAAVIVGHLALNINLEEFPQGIQHISSLIGTFQEYIVANPCEQDLLYDQYEQNWKLHVTPGLPLPTDELRILQNDYRDLLLQGLCILQKLALCENNCRIISVSRNLVSKIMVPVTCDPLQHTTNNHGSWTDIVEGSMEVLCRLTAAPGETGVKLRHEILSCEEAISTLHRIISCTKCDEKLQKRAIQILRRLYIDDTSESNKNIFFAVLVDIFMSNKSSSMKGYAGRALSELCLHDSDATNFLGGRVVDRLVEVLVQDKNDTCRQATAEILEHLCTPYTNDDEYLGKVKTSVTAAMLEVLGEIIRRGEKTGRRKEVNQDRPAKPKVAPKKSFSSSSHRQKDMKKVLGEINNCGDETDKENQHEHVQDMEENELQAVPQSDTSTNLLSSLLSLFGTVCNMTTIDDLSAQLDASGFLNNLKEVVVRKRANPTTENLFLCKTMCKMVITLMEHKSYGFIRKEELWSLIDALLTASRNMVDLGYSDGGSESRPSKHGKFTLNCLLKEAEKVHGKLISTSAELRRS